MKLGIWKFYVLLGNVGLAFATIGLVMLMGTLPALVHYNLLFVILGLVFVLYVLLVLAVVGLDLTVWQLGWQKSLERFTSE